MAAFAVFCRALLLALNPHRRLLLPHRHRARGGRLLRDDAAILMVLGASAIFHAITGPSDNDATVSSGALAAAGFLIWVAGVALLLLALTPGPFPGAAAARVAAQLVQAAAAALF